MRFCTPVLLLALAACGGGRTTYAHYPGAPATFDRTGANAEALAIADKVLAGVGGPAGWEKAKQIRWSETVVENGAETKKGEQAWDRWNARHYGRLDQGKEGANVAAYEIYGSYAVAYHETGSGKKQMIEGSGKGQAIAVARSEFSTNVTAMFMPYLLQEPGVKLEYGGLAKVDEAEVHELKVRFGDGDAAHKDLVYHVLVDKESNVIKRVDIEKGIERVGYELSDWKDVGGLKIPATVKNIGANQVATLTNFKVGSPDDELFTTPLQ